MSSDSESLDGLQGINPEWEKAIDTAMHASLMGMKPIQHARSPQQPPSPPKIEHLSSPSLPSSRNSVASTPQFQASYHETLPSSPIPPHTFETHDASSSDDVSVRRDPTPPRRHRKHKKSSRRLEIEREEKLELLGRLQFFMQEKGFQPLRALGPDDPIEDIRYEVYRANRDMSKKRNIKLMQKGLVTLTAAIEQISCYWNPLHLRLEGYSKSTLLTIRDWDDIFEELHWKWADQMAVPVEVKLILTLLSSIWFFHTSNNMHASYRQESPPPTPKQQPKMSGPNIPRPPPPPQEMPPMNIGNLMNGLGMIQTILGASNGGSSGSGGLPAVFAFQ